MPRLYTVSFSAVTVSAAQDLFELTPADDKPVRLHGITVGQTSDSGDAQDEQVQWTVIRGHATSGSGGAAATPQPVNSSIDTAAGFTAEVNNTTVASAGTGVTLHTGAFNVRAGLEYWWPPECRPGASQANTLLVVRVTVPVDALTMSGTLYVEETY